MGGRPEVVVVTGASGGVGRAIAHAFAKRGAHIGLLARGQEGLDGAAREVEALGGQALAVPTDVAEHEQVEAAAAAVEERFGEIDVWVNDAMATVFARFIDTEPEEFKRATEVTYLGTVYGTMVALKRMTARDRGKIVQVGSALSYRAIPLQAAYCGAKFGIRGFTDSIRTELRHDKSKVQITMVQLPGINTTQFSWCRSKLPDHPMPVPPIYQPEIPAEAVYWAAHHRRRELWVGYSAVEAILGQQVRAERARRLVSREDRHLRPAGEGHAGRRRARRQPVRAGRRRCGDARHLRRAGQDPQPAAVGRHPSRRCSPARSRVSPSPAATPRHRQVEAMRRSAR